MLIKHLYLFVENLWYITYPAICKSVHSNYLPAFKLKAQKQDSFRI